DFEVRKSAALSFVSMQPPDLRKSAVVLLCGGASVLFSEQSAVVPYPTKSTNEELNGQPDPFRVVELLASAILPAVTERFDVPAASGFGKFAPFVPPEA